MGYYGDYYGDYYRGDPGIFGFLGKAIKGVVGGAVGGFLKGGPLGALAGAAGGAVSATRANLSQAALEAGGSGSAYTPELRKRHALAMAHGPVASTAMMSSRSSGGPRGMRGGGGGGGGRRMNWANGKALGRAERRIKSAVHHFSKYMKWVHPGRAGHVVPKFARRRKK
jgi:hypothetical protein